MAGHIYAEGGKAVAEQGEVLLNGPDGIAISLTPGAAEQTGHELIRAAAEARDQAAGLDQQPDSHRHAFDE